MALKQVNNEMDDVFLQNENLQTQRYTVAHSSNMKTYKNNSNGIKYGLSELSNDKTYLETELPARKRLKPEAGLFDTRKYLDKTCIPVVNDDDFANEETYSSEISNILSSEQGFENNPFKKELTRSDLHAEIKTQSESSVLKSDTNSVFQNNILVNKLKLDSNKFNRYNFAKKSENHDLEPNLEDDLCENISNDISNQDTETEFDDEVNKCCELLNLDIPRMAVVSITDTKIANDNFINEMTENGQIHKCEIINHNNKSLNTLNPQSTKLVASLKTISNNINLETISLGKKLKIQDELLNRKEKSYKDNLEFKDEINPVLYNIVTSNSFLTTSNEKSINIKDEFFYKETLVGVENSSLESELQNNDKNDSNLRINNILNFNSASVKKPTFISERIQNYDSKSNTEHLNLTIQDTLNSDTLELKETNQNVSQDHLNDNKDDIDNSSSVDDSGDILSLYVESDIDFDETEEEISKLSESAPAILEGISENNETVFHANPDKSCIYTGDEVKKEGNFILTEKINPIDVNHPLNDKNCKSNVLDGISNNDCSENKNEFDFKINESFVSDYEISLLEDTDSNLSEESLDSEYEISLLEDDIDDEENQNEVHENKSDSNIGSNYLPNGTEKNEKIASEESLDSEYEISLLEEDINDKENENNLYEKKSNSEVGSKYLPNGTENNEKITAIQIEEQENEETADNVNLSQKETDEVTCKNKIYSKSISERNTVASEEKIPSNYKNNSRVANKTDSNVKISAFKEMKTFSKIKSSENTNEKNEQDFGLVTVGKKVLRLEKPTVLRSKEPDYINKESTENSNNSHFPLKLEINNESQISNKVILNSDKLKNSVEYAVTVNKTRYLADSACTNTTTRAKFEKAELDAHNSGESKHIINDEFQLSNKVVSNSIINEIRKSEEKVLITITNKHLLENTFTAEKTEKTNLGVSASGESKQDAKDIIPDYFDEEKEDLINPGWNKIKELSTDEERYRQVRDCWRSKSIPNPFKNLTYYSYRKRKINREEDNTYKKRQHKRHASSNLNDKNAKRSRLCTYIFDDRIKSIEKEKEIETKTLKEKMYDELNHLNEQCCQEEMGIDHFYGHSFDPRRQSELNNLRRDYQLRVQSVTDKYNQKANDCYGLYTAEINKLKNNRNEVLQFYSFYKGLNKDEYEDPTILTNVQTQELEEIENIYNQMDLHYK
ncbi:unnamed protein product [Larinioides sclopetarius]|uniref:Uncharacterized protein n=1 Tax=Larinioides sclopetarius TaxID=280406 RepID=A0AAV2AP00_9ARAC